MKNIYFISDIHLGFGDDSHEQMKREKLLDFLSFIQNPDSHALYILGDLFDFWYEWYHVVPKYWFVILSKIRQLVDAGIEVYFLTGNHDFDVGDYLRNQVGMHCHDGSLTFSYNAKKFFCSHGDGYAKADRGYRILKKIIRHPISKFIFRTFIPADWGMFLAKITSRTSRKYLQKEASLWLPEYLNFARKKFEEGFDFVLLGHLHKPTFVEMEDKVYLNCGNWIYDFSYACYDGDALTLRMWE